MKGLVMPSDEELDGLLDQLSERAAKREKDAKAKRDRKVRVYEVPEDSVLAKLFGGADDDDEQHDDDDEKPKRGWFGDKS